MYYTRRGFYKIGENVIKGRDSKNYHGLLRETNFLIAVNCCPPKRAFANSAYLFCCAPFNSSLQSPALDLIDDLTVIIFVVGGFNNGTTLNETTEFFCYRNTG